MSFPVFEMNKYPKITIVTPNYNLGDYLEATIESVLNQEYPNLEYIIVDAESTDQSIDIIRKYRSSISKIIIESDRGHADALTKGFAKSTGDVMGWVNSDDVLLPGSLHRLGEIFGSLTHVHWLQGKQSHINEAGELVKSNQTRSISRLRCLLGDYQWIQQESTFWTRDLWIHAGAKIDLDIKLAVDFDLWLRFFRHARLYTVQEALGAFRTRKGQRSSIYQAEYEEEVLRLIDKEYLLLSPRYKEQYRDILPSKARTVTYADRSTLPTSAGTEDLQPIRFDGSRKAYVDPNPTSSRRVIPRASIVGSVQAMQSPTLASLRDQHRGKRIFLMGNGPSLNKMDLELLKGEYVFGCNGCFLLFDRISWRPQFYTCVDTRVLPDRAPDIRSMHARYPEMQMFFPSILRTYDGSGRRTKTQDLIPADRNVMYFDDHPPDPHRLPYSAFSLEAERGLVIPNTVTITMMQLAYHLGFDEIYLIGCDTSYTVPNTVVQEGPALSTGEGLFLTSTADDDSNHFDPTYFGRDRAWHQPKVEDMIGHYQQCKAVLDELGVAVFNATVGGQLEVFPRVDYRDVLGVRA